MLRAPGQVWDCHPWARPCICSPGKESACQYRRCGFNPWSGKIPLRRKQQPILVLFLPGEFHGQRSLADYSPWGCKESDRTEHTHTHNILFSLSSEIFMTAISISRHSISLQICLFIFMVSYCFMMFSSLFKIIFYLL